MIKEIYIDFDGVIVDSQKKINEYYKEYNNTISEEWNICLRNIDWNPILENSKPINNSLEILKKLYILKKNIYILARTFSLNETTCKMNYLNNNGIFIPLITVPERRKKSEVIRPNKEKLLIDDDSNNINDWVSNNGIGILFGKEVNDLSFLLKKKIKI